MWHKHGAKLEGDTLSRERKRCVTIFGLIALAGVWANALADVRLPALISDHMVLQRDSRFAIWGWADPGEKVLIAFHGKEFTTRADQNGRWSASLGPFPAGGPYEMVISGKNRLVLHDVLLGDVWVASGQSNMEFPLGPHTEYEWMTGVANAEREIAHANYPQLRLFKVRHKAGFNKADDVQADTWLASTPESVADFSAVAYLFGREIHQRYHVPVGLIEASWSGTPAEAWVSEAGLRSFPELRSVIDEVKRTDEKKLPEDPNKATVLFNGMIHPLTPFRIKGVIWYQGETNATDNRSAQYRTLFPALIEDWRAHWGHQFPFLFVQLAGYGQNQAEPAEYSWADLREAQDMALAVPRTAMATAVDLGDENDIHPKNKQDVAHRLVLAAANAAYGERVVASGPTYQSMQVEGSRIRIKFSNLGSGLVIKDEHGHARGFEIAGSDGKFHWARAMQDGQDITVSNDAVRQPIAVRYAWSNSPDGNVFNREGLPCVPFRTDGPKTPGVESKATPMGRSKDNANGNR